MFAFPAGGAQISSNPKFKIKNPKLILPPGRQSACFHLSAPVDEDVRILAVSGWQ